MSTIFLVEDDENLVFGLKYSLEKEGYNVVTATTAANAMKDFEISQADMVLLDIMLPDGSGYDICKEIRKRSDVPVIFLTACDSEANVVAGLDIGADDYICKPFRLGELMSRIRAVMRRHTKIVVSDNEQNGLTAIEARLFNTLRLNKGQTLTRTRLLDMLWDNKGEFVDDNTLSVHISRLREKVGSEHIVTVRGVGYKWVD